MQIDRDAVIAALTPESVAAHYGITGHWRGRWLRSMRCAQGDHGSEAFGLARDGRWHCFGCDKGGDLLALVAAGEKLDVRADFPAVLKVAAGIAGVGAEDPWDPRPDPKPRPVAPPLPPFPQRLAQARKRAAWIWGRMTSTQGSAIERRDGRIRSVGELYLESRGLDAEAVRAHEQLRESPLLVTPQEAMRSEDMKSVAYTFSVPGVALPVRDVVTGEPVDVRIRRYEPRDGQPKIVGMLGGMTSAPAETGRQRILVGCYGHPEDKAPHDLTVLTEGWADYLTALCVWPDAWVLGAVEAGTMGLVAAHAAKHIASVDRTRMAKLLIVEQADPVRKLPDGTQRLGAADQSINEDPNSATKVAVRLLGPKRVGWLFCGNSVVTREGMEMPCKDLNDLVRLGRDPKQMVKWWSEVGTVPADTSGDPR